ncbi:hypothetical protein KGA66_21715 [Actinocrinis puniceicyclus]|uniref:DUF2178 domain-containing protein n=1 Tax=Actinocrinis puniceicyclus TaxID=977794 RepID=A0A8J7WT55_9ACTN|nr:hypothetical protein [Actinocrinis puniceicyclus]MBS2965684.1 hypothetical protein [Actinocrinis puniceicyclus]
MSQSDSAARGLGRKHNLLFWLTPAVAALGGIAYLVAAFAGGRPVLGVVLMAMMLLFAAGLVLAARRSETIRGLMDHRDERLTGIDLRATAAAGLALIVAVLIGAFVELGRGHSGAPYTWLGAIAGVTYIFAVLVQRVRQ